MCTILENWAKEWQFWIACISISGGLFTAYKYFDEKKIRRKQQEFENYHKLIEKIYSPLPNDSELYANVQRSAMFEMRNYKRYKNLTIIILHEWKDREKYKEVVIETLAYLNKNVK